MSISQYFEKIYYINLDEDTNKEKYFRTEIKKSTSLNSCVRFDAIIGKYLDIRLIPGEIITDRAKQDILAKKQKSYGISLTYGSLACALSHYFIYKECSIASRPYLIFEDDAILDSDFDKDLKDALLEIPNDYDILYLGYNEIPGFSKSPFSTYLSKPKGLITGLYGYALSNSGARKIIDTIFPLDRQIDSSISNNLDRFSVYCSTKRCVGVRTDFGSKTQQQKSCDNVHRTGNTDDISTRSWNKLFR